MLTLLVAAPAAAQTWINYSDIGPDLLAYETAYPTLCQRADLGLSVEGRHLWAIRISDNVLVEEDEPEVKYISSMHGDEIVGATMCMYLVDHLLTNYGVVPQVTNIVDEVELWIVPLMNPDGYDRSPRTRTNAQGIDLNRDFPDYGDPNTPTGRAVETQVIMNWCFGRSFTVSANFHCGALVTNYPFDNEDTGSRYTPDDDLMVYISEQYSMHNLPMWNGGWYHGITNGANWYMIWGGMQDWNYHFMGCNEVTIEVSNSDQPPASQIPSFWNDNRASMLAYVETSLIGIRGLVTDSVSGQPLAAMITVAGRDHEIYTDPDVGDYHRMLLPGAHDLTFAASGFAPMTLTNVTVGPGAATRLDIPMGPEAQIVSPNGGEVLVLGVQTTVTWSGSPSHAFHVQSTSNYGQFAAISDGFESGSLAPEYGTGGTRPWTVTTGEVHGGSYAARAGQISHGHYSWLTRTASGGDARFWYRVSSEAGQDLFNFYVDGALQLSESGEVPWTQYVTTLPTGNHELKWEYVKDASQSSGSDTVWIDDLEFTEDVTAWTDIEPLTVPGASSVVWTPAVVSPDCKVRVRTHFGSNVFGGWDESDAVFAVTDVPCVAGDTNEDTTLTLSGDLPVFVDLLLGNIGGTAYQQCAADVNRDGVYNGLDIRDFVALFVP